MPPKVKAPKKKKKKDDAELELEDKYRRTVEEIDALKDQLVYRREARRRDVHYLEDYKRRARTAEERLITEASDQRMTSANMTRQFKVMQTELSVKINNLEKELLSTQNKLVNTEVQLKTVTEERESMVKEKDLAIERLEQKLVHMERAFENVLHESLNSLAESITNVQTTWEERSNSILARNKQNLLEFGFNPMHV